MSPDIIVVRTFGHIELRAWIEFDGEKLIGMGSKKTYDETGKLIAYDEAPTGLAYRIQAPGP